MIDKNLLEKINHAVQTPYKKGAVILSHDYLCDSPVVFRHGDKWYMTYVSIDASCSRGYETMLAVSDNLTSWTVLGKIIGGDNGWDSVQTGGYAQFIDNAFGGSNEIAKIGGKYRFGYIGGNRPGYETDPLSIGMAGCDIIEDFSSYEKCPLPVLAPSDSDARRGETRTLYKPAMFEDPLRTLGHRYVCAYNAKGEDNRESIYLAVSDDGIAWSRYGKEAIIPVWECADDVRINGDPQIVRMMGVYVMFYFRFDKCGAYNTFAVSENLVDWVKWDGEPLIRSEHEWENVYAHKPWILSHDGVVYHFYCAVNTKGERFIALATSEE